VHVQAQKKSLWQWPTAVDGSDLFELDAISKGPAMADPNPSLRQAQRVWIDGLGPGTISLGACET
jgi:hypothetical protein